ncbi:putative ABC transport system permease protein [Dyella jiangningensis]|uniref:ABC transporter permease n=1 Tax=Dyella sp. AtDHG13 TaxID=1938897 RepID=UPI000881F80E|nr:ABC transporter permease [Dyella sp. AtDHG13]PXV58134.1 putative ABC transport system permease protein [Dyella sp. AtDHG13]SDK14437.1 putative ABC transport system permease protein [Dyella jiangningensis]
MRYNLTLAWHGLKRYPRSTVLAVITVAMGVAATMTTLALLHQLTADPLPGRSGHLYLAWVDTVRAKPQQSQSLNDITVQNYHRIKWDDAQALLHDHRAIWQAPMASVFTEIRGEGDQAKKHRNYVLATTSEFMPMFGVALRSGRGWTAAEDQTHAPVAVIDSEMAQTLYGTADAVGRELRLGHGVFRVIGVSAPFSLQPHFYDLAAFSFGDQRRDQVFAPVSALLDAGVDLAGSDACDEDGPKKTTLFETDAAHCSSLSYWVSLPDSKAASDFHDYLQHYVQNQQALAGYGKTSRAELTGVGAWLSRQNVVPDNVRLNAWLAGSFLLLCMANVAGLLAARFLRRGAEIGIRRALGAPRAAIFQQHVFEAVLICLLGGVLALPLTLFGPWTLRLQDSGFTDLAHLDPAMFAALFALALAVGVITGWLPAWRASRVEPGLQVKSA